jgi:hypothetical protein
MIYSNTKHISGEEHAETDRRRHRETLELSLEDVRQKLHRVRLGRNDEYSWIDAFDDVLDLIEHITTSPY